jgi:hypothetical protein
LPFAGFRPDWMWGVRAEISINLVQDEFGLEGTSAFHGLKDGHHVAG